MSSIMNVAIGHNNEGINLLEKGLNQQALLEFKKSAQMMYSITHELKAKGSTVEPETSTTICTTSQAPIATGNSFIRSAPIIMSCSDDHTASCTIESATVLVNMALCYHLDSLRPNGMQNALTNAISLYDMSYSLGLQINEDPRSHHIILTALNNLGQIHHDLGNFDKSRLYFEDLSTYVMFLGQEGAGDDAVSDRHEFVLNAMVRRNPNTSAAAA